MCGITGAIRTDLLPSPDDSVLQQTRLRLRPEVRMAKAFSAWPIRGSFIGFFRNEFRSQESRSSIQRIRTASLRSSVRNACCCSSTHSASQTTQDSKTPVSPREWTAAFRAVRKNLTTRPLFVLRSTACCVYDKISFTTRAGSTPVSFS